MKKIQRLCVAGFFTLMLATSTFAGDIETGKTPPPPPPATSSPTVPGDIPIDSASSDSVELIALTLLQRLLSVF